MWLKILSFIIVYTLSNAEGYRILAVIPYSGRSHYICQQPILEELARRGHEVVVVTPYEEKNPPPNYTQIVVNKKLITETGKTTSDIYDMDKVSFEFMLSFVWDGLFVTADAIFNTPAFKNFIEKDNSHFDLIFVNFIHSPIYYMFAHKYKAPIVATSTMGNVNAIGPFMGSPVVLSYMSHEFLDFTPPMTFLQKLKNIYVTLYERVWSKYYLFPKYQADAEKYFSSWPKPLPRLEDLENKISLILLNTHHSMDIVKPLVPSMVEIGGISIKEPKPLPKIIQEFLDGATEGAIYFSFGSNLKSSIMPREKMTILLNVFRKLQQRVLWKWEDENMTDKPDNVMIGKWLPQGDILAHKNVKLFITHGGLLSTHEAVYFGVPVIGMPFFTDQYLNTEKISRQEFGIKMKFSEITEQSLTTAINKIIYEPKYLRNAKNLSKRYKDRPMSAMDTAIYWIEYVVRHKGAQFLKSPMAEMSNIEINMFDVVAYVIVIFIICCYVLWKTIKYALIYKHDIFSKVNNYSSKDKKV